MPTNLEYTTATIANGATTSGAVDLKNKTLVGIEFPAALTGTSVSFTVARHGSTTFLPLYTSAGTRVSVTFTASSHIGLLASDFAGCEQVKIVSSASEGAERSITLISREV